MNGRFFSDILTVFFLIVLLILSVIMAFIGFLVNDILYIVAGNLGISLSFLCTILTFSKIKKKLEKDIDEAKKELKEEEQEALNALNVKLIKLIDVLNEKIGR